MNTYTQPSGIKVKCKGQIKRKLLGILMLCLLSVSLYGCGDKKEESSVAEGSGVHSSGASETESQERLIPESKLSYQVRIGDADYEFPLSFETFTEDGWQYEGDGERALSPEEYDDSGVMRQGELAIQGIVMNRGTDAQPLRACDVVGLIIRKDALEAAGNPEIRLADDFDCFAAGPEEVLSEFGTADYDETLENGDRIIEFVYDTYQVYSFTFDKEGRLSQLEIQHMGKE